jgi:hypothetical protein
MKYGKTNAEKIGRTVKIKTHTQNKQKRAIKGNTKTNTRKPSKTKYKRKSKQKIKQRKQNIGKPNKT